MKRRENRPQSDVAADAVHVDESVGSEDPWEEVEAGVQVVQQELSTRYWLGDGCWQVRRRGGAE